MLRLRSDSPNFGLFIKGILDNRARINNRVNDLVLKMIKMISIYGDKAVLAYNKKFENTDSRIMRIKVKGDISNVDIRDLFKIKAEYDRILQYHSYQKNNDIFYKDNLNVTLGIK